MPKCSDSSPKTCFGQALPGQPVHTHPLDAVVAARAVQVCGGDVYAFA